MKNIIIAAFLICITNAAIGQDFTNRKEITIRIGWSQTSISDARLSALAQKAWSPKYGLSYRKINTKRISQIDFDFTYANNAGSKLLSVSSIIPNVNYSYLRKTSNGIWLGGFIDHTTLLNLPRTRTSLFNNNPINYMLSAAIGPAIAYTRSETLKSNQINFTANAQLPVLAYVIQPEYGHPYPRKYLEQNTFSPTREGFAGPLLKSGRLVTINKYRSLNISFSVQYMVNDKFGLSLNLNSQLLYANTTGKHVSMNNHDIQLGASYIH